MAAWLQRHINGCAARRFAGCAQRENFRVGFTGTLVPAFANDVTIAH